LLNIHCVFLPATPMGVLNLLGSILYILLPGSLYFSLYIGSSIGSLKLETSNLDLRNFHLYTQSTITLPQFCLEGLDTIFSPYLKFLIFASISLFICGHFECGDSVLFIFQS
jgi:hypothetical protein